MNPPDVERLARELGCEKAGVARTIELLDAGNTLPFITRYRRDQTGGLDEEQIERVQKRLASHRQLEQRRETILRSLESQGKLTDALRKQIGAAYTIKRLEDLYLPFKTKKQSLAARAREQGLGPLAEAILTATEAFDLHARAAEFVTTTPVEPNAESDEAQPTTEEPPADEKPEDKKPEDGSPAPPNDKLVADAEAALTGAAKIIAEQVADGAELRGRARKLHRKQGTLVAKRVDGVGEKKAQAFKDYFSYREPLAKVPPHRVLAINRGERAKVLQVGVECDAEAIEKLAAECTSPEGHPHADFIRTAVADGVRRLLIPSLEREARRDLTETAESHSVDVFAQNLRNLLLQRPLAGKRVLAIDPGYKNGCKLAALDEFGGVLEVAMMHLVPTGKPKKAKKPAETEQQTANESKPDKAEEGTQDAAQGSITEQAVESAAETSQPSQGGEAAAELETGAQVAPSPNVSESQASIETGGGGTAPATPALPLDAEATSPESASTEAEPTPEKPTEETLPAPAAECSKQQDPIAEARAELTRLATEHHLNLVALGNGKACRPTEELVASLISDELKEHDLAYLIVNEAGASVYSTSQIGREELPDTDPMHRSAVSIGRRVQDPLSELVKIDPASIGVGLYQHDAKARPMRDSLDQVVQSCVSFVGVDVNSASAALLRYISGLNQLTARRITEHRKEHGPFRCRRQLMEVSGYGEAAFVQSAGFLRIAEADNPLDATWVHPESYEAAEKLVALLGLELETIKTADGATAFKTAIADRDLDELAKQLDIGRFTLDQLVDALGRPGRDPRDDAPPPVFRRDVVKIEDLSEGMELKGTVLNVVDFGAFVDIGLSDSGLVHVSRMSHQYVRDPHAVVAVGDQVRVWVAAVDLERKRVSLTMIDPAAEPPAKPQRHAKPNRGKRPQKSASSNASDAAAKRSDRSSKPAGNKPSGQRRSGKPAGAGGRHKRDQAGRGKRDRQPAGPRVFEKKAAAPPPELTDEMKQGKEAMRTFGDLLQFMQKEEEPEGKDE